MDEMKFAKAAGLTWGGGMLVLGLLAAGFGYGIALVGVLGSLYLGFAPTPVGALIGGVWGLIDGFIGGYIFAWLYNTV